MRRWVDHQGEFALPSTPARWPADWPPARSSADSPPGFAAFMAEQRPEILARQEAVKATRAASAGKSREQIRGLLAAELGARNVKMFSCEAPELIVHVGSKRVGRLDARHLEAFAGAIDAAADRDEDVITNAHLTRITGTLPYVLDLPLHYAGTSL